MQNVGQPTAFSEAVQSSKWVNVSASRKADLTDFHCNSSFVWTSFTDHHSGEEIKQKRQKNKTEDYTGT